MRPARIPIHGLTPFSAHVLTTLSQTVPLARTMAEKITAQRDWANGRARNASLARST
jgi:hypothetical protein